MDKYIVIIEDSPKELLKIALTAKYIKPSYHQLVLLLLSVNDFGDFEDIVKDIDGINSKFSGSVRNISELKKKLEKIEGYIILISNSKFDNIVENKPINKNNPLYEYYAELSRCEGNVVLIHYNYQYRSSFIYNIETWLRESNANFNKISLHRLGYGYNHYSEGYYFETMELIFYALSKYFNHIFDIDNKCLPFCILYDFLKRRTAGELSDEKQKKNCYNVISKNINKNNKEEFEFFIEDKLKIILDLINMIHKK
jgi:hypothetical protein